MPFAYANILGNFLAPKLKGRIEFFPWLNGTLLKIEIANMPLNKQGSEGKPPIGPFGFHIHEGDSCDDPNEKFQKAKGHYNPTNTIHPFHAGDLPSLLSNDGYVYMSVYTNRFKPDDVVGKTVIIHMNPDDYRTQPAGASGDRIACGVIEKIRD